MEYFYNTLECDNRTENPFAHSNIYQALNYAVQTSTTPRTRLEMHRVAIHPELAKQDNKQQQKSEGLCVNKTSEMHELTPIPARYSWYPNLDIESPFGRAMMDQ